MLLERNYRCKSGEIDLIMQEKHCITFVEVKYRKNVSFGGALYAVNLSKQKKIIKAAQTYLLQHGLSPEKQACRFDVIAIEGQTNTPERIQINWLKNAFYYE